MQQSNSYAPTTDIRLAYRWCDPLTPLEGEALERWYVDCSDVRGVHGFVQRIANRIEYASEPSEVEIGRPFGHVLVSGHKGCGKSTELQRLKQHLERKAYCVLYIDMLKDVTPDQMDAEAVILVTMRQLIQQLDEIHDIQLEQHDLDAIQEWFGDTLQEKADVKETELEVGGEAGLGAAHPLMKLLVGFKGYIKRAKSQERTFTVEYRRYLEDLSERLNDLLARARLALEDQPLVLILDGLDRMEDQYLQQEVFIDYQQFLADLQVHTAFTVPVSLVCSDASRGLQDAFGEPQLLPCIKVDTAHGLQKAREIVLRRCDDSLFEDGVIDYICRNSGGDVRNIMRLLREAFTGTTTPPVSQRDAESAFHSMVRGFANWLDEEDYDALVRHHRNRDLSPTDAVGRRLLIAGAILSYCNENIWFQVHPAVQSLKRFRDKLEASAEETGAGESDD